ncbi:PREDICTED: uncharacterized protein LOC109591883 [Amphimedon queenslandica]|uniref:histone acetyltransferase n=2 Tax=Amphimedon queenslandica TaxID=400682 RepID=A0AAN0K1M8_AMPQE|nr:PREDICTED: uncharacterized protein LOC109591883 [Amphimedon queenslandica]|eukprot:XP_019863048.1 PREDICTED: uncharacterized protein LOC109591883 [Amphimedon queenslandica]
MFRQQLLVLLLHAHCCQQKEKEQQAHGGFRPCALPHCRTMKNVLNHMTECKTLSYCQFRFCSSSRQVIYHWKNCNQQECHTCKPIRAVRKGYYNLMQAFCASESVFQSVIKSCEIHEIISTSQVSMFLDDKVPLQGRIRQFMHYVMSKLSLYQSSKFLYVLTEFGNSDTQQSARLIIGVFAFSRQTIYPQYSHLLDTDTPKKQISSGICKNFIHVENLDGFSHLR